MIFEGKYFSHFILSTEKNLIVLLPLFLEILINMCIAIVYFPDCDIINAKINLSFLIKLFSHTIEKVRTNILIPKERKELLRKNKKRSLPFLETMIEANKKNFLECVSKILSYEFISIINIQLGVICLYQFYLRCGLVAIYFRVGIVF